VKKLQPPRGTYDALPEQARRLRYVEAVAADVFGRYGYGEIRPPMFEFTDVFARTVGDATDIVSKEMYTFEDRGGESLSLRPECTAAVVRAYYTNKLKHQLPLKLMYIGAPMFRYERPQKGRFRQFHQLGIECIGVAEPWADVEVIATGVALLRALGLAGMEVRLNTLGTLEDRQRYRQALLDYFDPVKKQLSPESQERLSKNPLRVLDSKQQEDQPFIPKVPKPTEYLSEESRVFYDAVKGGLDALGLAYVEEPTLVRGLDYYSHTVFEIHSKDLGAQSQVLAGGRYDGLFRQMGPEDVPAVGFAGGMERLEMLLGALPAPEPPVVVVVQDVQAQPMAMHLAEKLRAAGQTVLTPLVEASTKAQFKRADKLGAKTVLVLGTQELAENTVTVKNMITGEQKTIPAAEL
jgi:histidyl-tRNA synthetase